MRRVFLLTFLLLSVLGGVLPASAQTSDTPITFTLNCLTNCTQTTPDTNFMTMGAGGPIHFTVNDSVGFDVTLHVVKTFHYQHPDDGNGCYFSQVVSITDNSFDGQYAGDTLHTHFGTTTGGVSCSYTGINSGTVTSIFKLTYHPGTFELDDIASKFQNGGGNPLDTTFVSATITVPNGTLTLPPAVCTDPTVGTNACGNGRGITGACVSCIYHPTGDLLSDAPKLVDWGICQLSQIYWCDLRVILIYMWGVMLSILYLISWARVWVSNSIELIANWYVSIVYALTGWLGGVLQNVVNQLANYIQTISPGTVYINSSGGSNFWDVLISLFNSVSGSLNNLVSGLTGTINNLVNSLSGIASQIISTIASLIYASINVLLSIINGIVFIATLLYNIVKLIIALILWVVTLIYQTLTIILVLIGTFQAAFTNALSVTAPGIGAGLDCSVDPTFQVCLGLWIIDNTIMSSSYSVAGVNVSIINWTIIIALGLVAVDRLFWFIRRVQAITRDDE